MDLPTINKNDFYQLSESLNKLLLNPEHIHLMGICGTGMASLAGFLKKEGYNVTGSDENIYPPMSIFLKDLNIPVMKGYSSKNLNPVPDLVIVGNVITRHNPEAVELGELKIPYLSFPQAIRQFAIKDKKSIVIAGTHGKTTTSAICSWVLEKARMDPGFMVGGILNNFNSNFKKGNGPFYVIEGDEYDTAFFDKGPKFLHYAPFVSIITSIEFDHADIYRDLDHVISSFRKLIELMPSNGLLIANSDDPVVVSESKRAKCRVMTYGMNEMADWRATNINNQKELTEFRVIYENHEYASFSSNLYGDHNISNLLSIIVLSNYLGIDIPVLSKAILSFKGVKRRQEIKGEPGGILILDDFAHHPTAVEKTITAVKNRYKNRRLIAVFEPRSNSSRRKIFQKRYSESFNSAHLILIPEPPLMEKVAPEERFSSQKLVKDLKKKGLGAVYFPDTNKLVSYILKNAKKGDVILIMSNGAFDNIHEKLLNKLKNSS